MKYKFDHFYENFFNKGVNPYSGSSAPTSQQDNNEDESMDDEPTADATEDKIGDAFSQLAKNKSGGGLNATTVNSADKQNVQVMKKGLEDAGYKGADLRRALMTALRVELDGLRMIN